MEEVKETVETPEIIENATQEVTTSVEVSTDTYSYDDEGHFTGAVHETHRVSTYEVQEVPKDGKTENSTTSEEVVANSCEEGNSEAGVQSAESADTTEIVAEPSVSMEEFEALQVKCSQLEAELEVQKNNYSELLEKYAVLEEYKANKESENMKANVELALNSVCHILDANQIELWREKSKAFSVETVNQFTNELKAFAFDLQEKNGFLAKESIRNSIPREIHDESLGLWERIERKYKF